MWKANLFTASLYPLSHDEWRLVLPVRDYLMGTTVVIMFKQNPNNNINISNEEQYNFI